MFAQLEFQVVGAASGPELRNAELRYDALTGDFVLKTGSADFSAMWGWIPLLDLAYCLKDMCDELRSGKAESVFEFTESADQIRLERQEDDVLISADYTPDTARVNLQEFCSLVSSAARQFYREMEQRYPQLLENPGYPELRAKVFAPNTPKHSS